MACSVCGSSANESPATIDGHVVRCPECGEYEVTASAELLLARAERPTRRLALVKAKTFQDRYPNLLLRPCITTHCF
jgi:hypothetical protein